jgi:hypothetical protein
MRELKVLKLFKVAKVLSQFVQMNLLVTELAAVFLHGAGPSKTMLTEI